MASLVRQTTGRRSRESGSQVGIQLNTFGLDKIQAEINGHALAVIMLEAAQPMLEQATQDWPVDTGASRDSIELVTVEEGDRRARIVLQAGGQKLENDPRNKSGIDYAPFLEFGTEGRAAHGIIRDSVFDNEEAYRSRVRTGVKGLIEGAAS